MTDVCVSRPLPIRLRCGRRQGPASRQSPPVENERAARRTPRRALRGRPTHCTNSAEARADGTCVRGQSRWNVPFTSRGRANAEPACAGESSRRTQRRKYGVRTTWCTRVLTDCDLGPIATDGDATRIANATSTAWTLRSLELAPAPAR